MVPSLSININVRYLLNIGSSSVLTSNTRFNHCMDMLGISWKIDSNRHALQYHHCLQKIVAFLHLCRAPNRLTPLRCYSQIFFAA